MNQSFSFTVAVKCDAQGLEYVEAAGSSLFQREAGATPVWEVEVGIVAPFEITVVGKEPRLLLAFRVEKGT